MEVAVLFAMVIGLLLLGVPIAVSLGISSVLFLLVQSDTSLASIAQTLFQAMAGHYTLLAIPFFILASSFMSTGGVAKRIIRFSIAIVGHFPGGLAIAGVFACMLFAALSGSSPATVVAIGSIVIAGMISVGYTREFAAGVICNAGTLGILIPPSIVMVVYAAATDVSVGRMFLAGVFPGLLAGLMLMVAIYIVARIKGLPAQPWAGWGEVFDSARDASWGLMLIVIILGGIYGGIFTPTEAAVAAVCYALVLGLVVYRTLTWKHLVRVAMDTIETSAAILMIVASASIFAWILTSNQVASILGDALLGITTTKQILLLIMMVMVLLIGLFMETIAAITILVPVLMPIALQAGIDPVHLGIIVILNLMLGLLTPPVGMVLFVLSEVSKVRFEDCVKATAPFLVPLIAVLMLITFIPDLALWLPNQVYR